MQSILKRVPGLQRLGTTALAATFIVACQGSGSFARTQEHLAQIKDNQDKILKRLDEIESKIGSAPARPGAKDKGKQGPKPGRPDPSKTYKVDVWPTDSAKGPADAKITLVEWSDYQ